MRDTLSNEISLSSTEQFNWGVYNLTMILTDKSTVDRLTTEATTKIFAINSTAFNTSLFADLSIILDNWAASGQFEVKNSNGDELELLQREYLAFYASQALEKASRIRDFFFANSSLTIIGLVSFFSLIATVLVAVIIYKHYSASVLKNDSKVLGQDSSLTSESSVSSLPDSKTDFGPDGVDYFSPSNSFFENSTISTKRTFSYPPPSLRSQKLDVIDCIESRLNDSIASTVIFQCI